MKFANCKGWKTILYGIILSISLSVGLVAQEVFPVQSKHSSSKKIVDIQVTTSDGSSISLAEILRNDRNYVVSLMASWCGPCRAELNAFQKISERWKCDLNTEIIGISIERPTDTHKLFDLVKRQKWTIPIVHDKMAYTSRELGVFDIPHTYLINRKREIVFETEGYSSDIIKKYEAQIGNMNKR